jgi:hypothetical protein
VEPDEGAPRTPAPHLADCRDVDDARDQRRRVEDAASGAGVVRRGTGARPRAAVVRDAAVRELAELEVPDVRPEAVRREDRTRARAHRRARARDRVRIHPCDRDRRSLGSSRQARHRVATRLPLPRRARGDRERTARACRKADRNGLALQRWQVELRRKDAPVREANPVARAARYVDAVDATRCIVQGV